MRRIVYASLSAAPMTEGELEDMLVVARMRNEVDDITGLLLYFPADVSHVPSFLQLLEGPEAEVEETYARITHDLRHHDLRVVSRTDTEQRLFPEWTMGLEYVTRQDLARAVPGLQGTELVVMAQLVEDPEAAERLLVRHCVGAA